MSYAHKFNPEYECEFCGEPLIDNGGYEEYWGARVWCEYWECTNEDCPGEHVYEEEDEEDVA